MSHRVRRFFFFILAIIVGIAAGLGYGWGINPRETVETGPHTLRLDYQTDYVLMTSELFNTDGDAAMAIARLSFLGDESPLTSIRSAINYAENNQYDPADLQMMNNLMLAVEALSPSLK